MDGLDCRHQTSDLNQNFHQWQFSFYVYHPISHFQTHIKYHKIINTDTCMPRGGPNYKLFFCPQLHNRYIYIYLNNNSFQPNYFSTNFFWRYIPKISYKSNIPQAAFAGSRCFLPSAGDAVRGLWPGWWFGTFFLVPYIYIWYPPPRPTNFTKALAFTVKFAIFGM